MRDDNVSIAKAIAIILMVLAHSGICEYAGGWINMFHMPLFFFFAGYCLKEEYLTNFSLFAKRRIVGIYLPYLKWSLIFLAFHNIFFSLNIYNREYGIPEYFSETSFIKRFVKIVVTMDGHEQLLGGYWFLKSLFVGSFIGYLSIRYITNPIVRSGLLFVITAFLSVFNIPILFYLFSGKEFFAALLYMIGYEYKSKHLNIHSSPWIIPIGILLVTIGVEYWRASLLDFNCKQILPYSISAIIGTLMVFKLSSIIANSIKNSAIIRYLIYIGNNTLTILTWHFLCFKIVSLIITFAEQLPVGQLADFPVISDYSRQGWFVMYFIVGLFLPLQFAKIKYLR